MSKIDFTLLNKTVALFGKRGSGKSVMAKQLIEDEKRLFKSNIFLFSPTEKINHDYEDLVLPNHIFDSFSDTWARKLLDKLSNTPKKELRPILLVFDDCGSERDWATSKEFIKFFTRGRHLFLSVLTCNQYVFQLPKVCRSNLDFVLASQQPSQSLDILTDEFNINLKNDDFRNLYKKATVDYGFFLINNSATKNDDINSIYGKMRASI